MKYRFWPLLTLLFFPQFAHADWGYTALRIKCDPQNNITEFEPFIVWNGENELREIKFKDLQKTSQQKIGTDTFIYIKNAIYSPANFQCKLKNNRKIIYIINNGVLLLTDKMNSAKINFSIKLADPDANEDIRGAWFYYGPTYLLSSNRDREWTQCFGFEKGDRRKGECLPVHILAKNR